jgi:MoxR-like ATPase
MKLYRGGTGTTQRLRAWEEHEDLPRLQENPATYIPSEALRQAVNVALQLRQPLLVTGEPGTGKSQLAFSIAHDLGLGAPLVFHTTTTATARDLFYRYDALAHFQDVNLKVAPTQVESYIEFEALGRAIILSNSPGSLKGRLPERLLPATPRQSVVLIDEIDKAPRDFPNDILNEIEKLTFRVRETGESYAADPRFWPILVLTSNAEAVLPEAFLRRCIFFHIDFPDRLQLRGIVVSKLGSAFGEGRKGEWLTDVIRHFLQIRKLALRKRPATAEFLAWLQILDRIGVNPDKLQTGEAEALLCTYSILAKNHEDLDLLRREVLTLHDHNGSGKR